MPSSGSFLGEGAGFTVTLGLGQDQRVPFPELDQLGVCSESVLLNRKLQEKPDRVSLTTFTQGPS